MKNRKKIRLGSVVPILVLTFVVAGCAHQYDPAQQVEPYGFFSGLWHGLISPFSIIFTKVFNVSSIDIIGKPNTGSGYESGFGFGVAQWLYVLYLMGLAIIGKSAD